MSFFATMVTNNIRVVVNWSITVLLIILLNSA